MDFEEGSIFTLITVSGSRFLYSKLSSTGMIL